MGDYESGYDPKYGYNRNAFAHKTIPQAIIGRVVKLIALPIGLASEVYHNEIDKQRRSDSRVNALSAAEAKISTTFGETANQEVASPSGGKSDDSPPVYVEVPEDQAEELIASYQAVPADDKTATHELVPQHSEDDGVECDEADWALDEAASETEDKSDSKDDPEADREEPTGQEKLQSTPTKEVKVDSRTKKVPSQKIPFPVILPQRRPGTKARGFVRAYAPVLQDAGIDQDAFISFLKNFHKAAQASPIFDVIMIATGIASMFPDLVVDLSIQAAEIAIGIAQEVQKRWRTNKFLDQANRDIFIPKGLFALIVTYKTNDNQNTEIGTKTVDLGASAMVKYGDALALPEDAMSTEGKQQIKQTKLDEMKAKVKQFRISSGETRGEAELPVTCAPLVFPALDAFADANEPKANEGVANSIITKSKSASKFVNDYFDRRAQASYAYKNPASTLTFQMAPAAPQFRSRFADPNDATNMHFFTLITGGNYKAEPLGASRRYEKAQRKAEEKRGQGIREKLSRRLLKEGVLYLMVVNMPTDEELEKAKKEIQEAKLKKQKR